MNFTNFNRKYVKGTFDNTVCLWEHKNGSVCEIDMYWTENYVYINFENGPTLDIKIAGSTVKVGFHDDYRVRDLGNHASWNGDNRRSLVKLYLRHVLGQKTTEEQREAIWDIVSNELEF